MVHWKDEPTAAVTVALKASTMDRPRDCPNVHLKDLLLAAAVTVASKATTRDCPKVH